MNDFDLHYLYHAHSEELIKQAENERQARELINAAKSTRRARHVRHEGIAARVAKALGRREHHEEARGEPGPARFQPAK